MGPIVFFGNEKLASGISTAAPLFHALLEADYEISFVVINQSEMSGRNKSEPAIVTSAKAHGVPVLFIHDYEDLIEVIQHSGAKVGILAAYGRIVPQDLIDAFEFGILNIHPSLLPKYRGSTPIETAILNGDDITGVSVMQLVKKMDAGPLYGFGEIPLDGDETKQMLYEMLSDLGAQLLLRILPSVLNNTAVPIEQDHPQATFTKQITKTDGIINWKESNIEIERKIRAYSGWPGAKTKIAQKDVEIISANLLNYSGTPGKAFKTENNELAVYCGEGSILIEKIKPAGKNEMTSGAFLAGNPI